MLESEEFGELSRRVFSPQTGFSPFRLSFKGGSEKLVEAILSLDALLFLY